MELVLLFISVFVLSHSVLSDELDQRLVPQSDDYQSIKCTECSSCESLCGQLSPPPPPPPSCGDVIPPPPPRFIYMTGPPPPRFVYVTGGTPGSWYTADPSDSDLWVYSGGGRSCGIGWRLLVVLVGVLFMMNVIWSRGL